MPKHFDIDLSGWLVNTGVILVDSVASAGLLFISIKMIDPNSLLDANLLKSLGAACGLIALKTLFFALQDFKKYVKQVDE